MASQYAMIVCVTRHPTRNFRPNPAYYEAVERIAADAGVSMNVLLQALLREFGDDPAGRLATLAPHLEAVTAETPRRGRPTGDTRPGSGS